MLIARFADGRFVIGIDARNVELLKQGKPMKIDLVNFGGQDDVLLMYGQTLEEVVRELERALGEKLPPAMPPPSGRLDA